MSQSEEELEEEEEEEPVEEFVDAPDSQYNPNTEPEAEEDEDDNDHEIHAPTTPTPNPRPRLHPSQPTNHSSRRIPPPAPDPSRPDTKWRKRVESALVKMTAEVAALREQLESRRLFTHSRRYNFFRFVFRFFWAALKHVAVDIFILGILLAWMRAKGDRRLEGVVRGVIGDALERVRRVRVARLLGRGRSGAGPPT